MTKNMIAKSVEIVMWEIPTGSEPLDQVVIGGLLFFHTHVIHQLQFC
jgi:hypothetical protein